MNDDRRAKIGPVPLSAFGRFRFRKNQSPRHWIDVIFEEGPTQIVVFPYDES